MRLQMLFLAAALALAAGCNKGSDGAKPAAAADKGSPPSQTQTNTPTTPQVNTPTTPSSAGATASHEEKKEGANPQQGQVDPKSPEQHRDFQQKGDAAGPTSPDTKPKPGN